HDLKFIMKLDDGVVSLINDKSFAYISLIDADGFPHVTPVWVDTDGKNVIINTAEGRKKQKLAKKGSAVTVTITNPSNPYKYVMIKGKIKEQTGTQAEEHIDKMASKYMGVKKYPKSSPDERRVLIYIEPVNVIKNL
ncbi:MAG: TIGR03618 family F420-dependent PPOX class oxidoreductase, partial [Nitrososphaerota archaeon]|nr:TIGR03618 family F420-dependent PPOX class oxidoreductase [Nitrososphaerota archaeon]MDG6943767.1 TIGR03618 family F420-dependent PPOX class oxidoreductase [Nitrososphaerota archaeon]